MNILFICSAKVWGGNEKWSAMAIAGLKESNNVIFLGKNPELHKKFNANGISYTAPFSWNFGVRTLSIINNICKKHHIDVIISTKKKEYFLAGITSRKRNIRHIIRLGIVRKMRVPFWNELVYRQLNDGIVVNAQRIKDGLQENNSFKNHPIKVIYNGIEDFKINSSTVEESKFFRIVSTGMLTNRKGFHILIGAISLLPINVRSTIKLHIVGEGREEQKLRALVNKLSLNDTVVFEGFSDKPTQFLSGANLFTLISGNEGISNAVIEAMYSGVSVLTTTAGGAAEVIEDGKTGFLTTRSEKEVAEALLKIIALRKDELKLIAQKGKERATNMFNLRKMIAELIDFTKN